MRRIVLRLPIELIEKVGADNRQFTSVPHGRTVRDACERKSEGQDGGKGEVGQGVHDKISVCAGDSYLLWGS